MPPRGMSPGPSARAAASVPAQRRYAGSAAQRAQTAGPLVRWGGKLWQVDEESGWFSEVEDDTPQPRPAAVPATQPPAGAGRAVPSTAQGSGGEPAVPSAAQGAATQGSAEPAVSSATQGSGSGEPAVPSATQGSGSEPAVPSAEPAVPAATQPSAQQSPAKGTASPAEGTPELGSVERPFDAEQLKALRWAAQQEFAQFKAPETQSTFWGDQAPPGMQWSVGSHYDKKSAVQQVERNAKRAKRFLDTLQQLELSEEGWQRALAAAGARNTITKSYADFRARLQQPQKQHTSASSSVGQPPQQQQQQQQPLPQQTCQQPLPQQTWQQQNWQQQTWQQPQQQPQQFQPQQFQPPQQCLPQQGFLPPPQQHLPQQGFLPQPQQPQQGFFPQQCQQQQPVSQGYPPAQHGAPRPGAPQLFQQVWTVPLQQLARPASDSEYSSYSSESETVAATPGARPKATAKAAAVQPTAVAKAQTIAASPSSPSPDSSEDSTDIKRQKAAEAALTRAKKLKQEAAEAEAKKAADEAAAKVAAEEAFAADRRRVLEFLQKSAANPSTVLQDSELLQAVSKYVGTASEALVQKQQQSLEQGKPSKSPEEGKVKEEPNWDNDSECSFAVVPNPSDSSRP